jgi:release factor glutamine methyltransferase
MSQVDQATWRAVLARAASALGSSLEARRLLEEVAGLDAAGVALALDAPADPAAVRCLALLVERRRSGEPIQHVLGHWSFRTIELTVDARALVPRPETEVVAGHALAELARRRAERRVEDASDPGHSPRRAAALAAVDLGTGSGAIACAIVSETSDVRVVGVDSSSEALALAAVNRDGLDPRAADRFALVEGEWYGGLPVDLRGALDCIVANPPYLAEQEWPGLDPVVREHDPYAALVAGPSGLEAIEAIVAGAPAALGPGGALVLEIAPAQNVEARRLATAAGAFRVEVARDLAGRDRVLVAQWTPGARSSRQSR